MTGLVCPQFPQTAGEEREGLGFSWDLPSLKLSHSRSGEDTADGTQCPQGQPGPCYPQGTITSQQELWLLNSLCHDCVYVGPHQPQVLINLCLQRARGDQVNDATTRQSHPATPNAPCRQTYLVLVIYNGESKHRHHSWGEKEHSVMLLQSRFLQRRDLLQWQTHYRTTWSADLPESFVLKMHFAQASQIWSSPLLWDWELQKHKLQSSSSRRDSVIEQWIFTGKGNEYWWLNWGEGMPGIGCFV